MGYEPEVPPIPTRDQEVRYITDLANNFKSQPYTKHYSPEYLRINKIELSKSINTTQMNWYANFALGSVLIT